MAVPYSTPRRDLFGDVAVSKGLLTWAQVRDILRRQLHYKEIGIPIRVGEVAVEMGLLTPAQRNDILSEQTRRRQSAAKPSESGEVPALDHDTEISEAYQFGRFRLDKRLGGVMGVVYRGLDTQSNQMVALKVLPRNLAFDSTLVERF